MRVLVDTSVWMDHFHTSDAQLVHLLQHDEVLTHPCVLGELALAGLQGHVIIMSMMASLEHGFVATHDEVMQMIELRKLYGRGLGYVQAHLLASALLTPGAMLWTRDPSFRALVQELGLEPPLSPLPFLQERTEGYRQA